MASSTWLLHTPLHPQWFVRGDQRSRLRHLHRLTGEVLDIGCSDRALAARLPAGCGYLGLDYYVTVRTFYATQPDVYGDASALPLRSGTMDGVMLFEVLEHVPDPSATLSEVARVLRPGGVLLLSVPFVYPIHNAPFDFHRFTRYALQREIKAHDFTVEVMETRLRSIEVGGLMLSLALGDACRQILRVHRWALPVVPLLGMLVCLVNMGAWILARLLPGSEFMPGGYQVVAVRNP